MEQQVVLALIVLALGWQLLSPARMIHVDPYIEVPAQYDNGVLRPGTGMLTPPPPPRSIVDLRTTPWHMGVTIAVGAILFGIFRVRETT